MPASYQIPPWIAMQAPPNPAEAYISNLRVGAQIGQEQAQLAQRRELAQMQLLAKQQEAAQEQRLAQQKIEYDHAMRQAELGLEQQKLEEAKQVNQIKIQAAARQFAAQQAIEADIAGGMSPEAAMLRHAHGMDFSAGDIGALVKAAHPAPAFDPQMIERGGRKLMQIGPNRYQVMPEPPQTGPVTAEKVIDPNTGQPDPNAYATRGPTGTPSIHNKPQPRPQPVPDSVKLERQVLTKQIEQLRATLKSPTVMAKLGRARLAEEQKKPRKERIPADQIEPLVQKEIMDKIQELEDKLRATGTQKPNMPTWDPKTRKIVRPQVSEAAPESGGESELAAETAPEPLPSEDQTDEEVLRQVQEIMRQRRAA